MIYVSSVENAKAYVHGAIEVACASTRTYYCTYGFLNSSI